ncbi:MAG: methyltransferase domain-containing protein [Bacillota bacterium]|nr:methyltransferase domain-containing protein [Bacillota bacterium]MDI3253449.1 methyltransferase domain-containing protein [Bacillota bacterium]
MQSSAKIHLRTQTLLLQALRWMTGLPSDARLDFNHRVSPHQLPELMDGDCSYEDFCDCLRSLEQVNRWLLGYRPTLAWLKRLPHGLPHPIHIVDVGCGGGDLLRKIADWAAKEGVAVQLTGMDLNPYSARVAADSTPQKSGITWVTGDALAYRPDKPVDVIVSSLMAHHLEDSDIVLLLRWMEATARLGWFINDLERSEHACLMFACIAKVVRWHPFVRHDGPVSFRRAFRKEDWIHLLAAADVPQEAITIEHWRPGRLCVGRWK